MTPFASEFFWVKQRPIRMILYQSVLKELAERAKKTRNVLRVLRGHTGALKLTENTRFFSKTSARHF